MMCGVRYTKTCWKRSTVKEQQFLTCWHFLADVISKKIGISTTIIDSCRSRFGWSKKQINGPSLFANTLPSDKVSKALSPANTSIPLTLSTANRRKFDGVLSITTRRKFDGVYVRTIDCTYSTGAGKRRRRRKLWLEAGKLDSANFSAKGGGRSPSHVALALSPGLEFFTGTYVRT